MSKQSVSKSGKVVQFPGTQPFTYEGRMVGVHVGIWPDAKESKSFKFNNEIGCYFLLVTETSFERAMNAAQQYADELGICL